MRKLFAIVAVVVLFVGTVTAEEVKLGGTHLCCPACVRSATKAISGIDGISNVKADRKTKSVSFTAKDAKVGTKAVHALFDAGFFGKVSMDGKAVVLKVPVPSTDEVVSSVTINDVHVCCGACKRSLTKIFPGAKLSYTGKGATKTVTVTDKELSAAAVIKALRKGGFNGKVK